MGLSRMVTITAVDGVAILSIPLSIINHSRVNGCLQIFTQPDLVSVAQHSDVLVKDPELFAEM